MEPFVRQISEIWQGAIIYIDYKKKEANSTAFSLQLIINLLLISKGGIFGALHLSITLLRSYQYDFRLVLGSNLFPILFVNNFPLWKDKNYDK